MKLLLIHYVVLLDANYVVRARDWIVEQAAAAAIIAFVIAAVPLILKKMWQALGGLVVLTAVALIFISSPDNVEALGKTIYDLVFK